MSNNLPDEVQDIAEQSQEQDVVSDTNVDQQSTEKSRKESIRSGYDALAEGQINDVVATRDEHLAAILHGLSQRGDLGDVVSEAAQRRGYEVDIDDPSNSSALEHLAKLGLHMVDEEILDDALEAHKGFRADEVDSI